MKGYKFNTELEADLAINTINLAAEIPSNLDSSTKSWTRHNLAKLNDPAFYFIVYDEFTESVLGEPEILKIIFEEV